MDLGRRCQVSINHTDELSIRCADPPPLLSVQLDAAGQIKSGLYRLRLAMTLGRGRDGPLLLETARTSSVNRRRSPGAVLHIA